MTDHLERTPVSQADHDAKVLSSGFVEVHVDPFDDDEPIVATCDLSNPEVCESCT